jgi:hypothetical protein
VLTRPRSFDELQATLPDRISSHHRPTGTVVVLPSLSFPADELAKITAIERYEERLLHLVLLLRDPAVRVVYVTSLPIDPAIVDYYLHFLPDPQEARTRLTLVALGAFSGSGLATDLAAEPATLQRLRDAVGDDADRAVILPFNVTDAERRIATELRAPLFAAHPDLVALGSKTGSRRIARAAGVPVLPGVEDLWSTAAISAAVDELRLTHPGIAAVVVKLNNGFSGQGNAMVTWDGVRADLADRETVFCAAGETWTSFTGKIAREGAIVEQLVTDRAASPSAQAWISPRGDVEVVSTHDQLLGGPGGQVYLGCRYPADPAYRQAIVDHTEAVGARLAAAGVAGPFALDFTVLEGERIRLSEINLRLGGTTHPFGMARAVTGATGDARGEGLRTGDGVRVYVASDNLKEPALVGTSPADVIARVRSAGLAFDPSARTGVTLHLLGAVPGHGKLGAVAIGRSRAHAEELFTALADVLRG